MDGWAQVRWTQARQVAVLMGTEEDALPPPEQAPRAYFADLREAGEAEQAVSFLAHALSRFEAIAWAARVLEEEANAAAIRSADRRALDYALRWLGDPDDGRRRAAHEAGDAAGERSPERMLALAVFFSGGSISQPDLAPVLPPPEVAGRFAAAAISLAAHRGDDASRVLGRALELGDEIASKGAGALAAA